MTISFAGKKIAVLGLGMEGEFMTKWLTKQGAHIVVFDEKEKKDIKILKDKDIKSLGRIVKGIFGKGAFRHVLDGDFDVVFRSAGVHPKKEEILMLKNKGIEVLSETMLFFKLCPCLMIGITGTKGKGTIATLTYHMLKSLGKDVYLAGNIGRMRLDLLPNLKKDSWVILELSSFQLIDLYQSPHIAVVSNIYRDHLDIHTSFKEYIEAKKNIVRFQTRKDFAVLNEHNPIIKQFFADIESSIYWYNGDTEKVVGTTFDSSLNLKGKHNRSNLHAAILAVWLCLTKGKRKLLSYEESLIRSAVRNFTGLEHRLEKVGTYKGVIFYNDALATIPEVTLAALQALGDKVQTLILGGTDRGQDFSKLIKKLLSSNIKNIVLFPDTGKRIFDEFKKHKKTKKINFFSTGSMERAVSWCYQNTDRGKICLLSPASASYTNFENYADEGNQFKENIRKLAGKT